MKKLFALVSLVLLMGPAFAADVTIEYSWPESYCNGDPLAIGDIQAAEIYISESTIPRNSPDGCTGADDVPPPSAILATVDTPDTQVTIDLECGKTYFMVMRVQGAAGEWSNFSGEAVRDVGCGKPNIPIIIRIT